MIRIALFGKFSIECDGKALKGCDSAKAEELLCYLLVHRNRPHAREMLASLLWGEHCTTAQARKYLRNSLWRLQATLDHQQELASSDMLLVEPHWIQFKTPSTLWIDVMAFDGAYAAVKGVSGYTLTDQAAQDLERATRLYRGYFLENGYQDWCLCERERLHQIYLIMLDKLMGYCEAHQRYEVGLSYGRRILQYDRAREHTHRHMMSLYYLAGNRTDALRQYKGCEAALKEELDIAPSERTRLLYEQIRTARLFQLSGGQEQAGTTNSAMRDVLTHLHQLQASLTDMQRQIRHAEQAAELGLRDRRSGAVDQQTLFP